MEKSLHSKFNVSYKIVLSSFDFSTYEASTDGILQLPGRIYSKYVVITASREGTKGVNSSWSAIRAGQAPHIIDTFVGFSVVYTD